MGETEPDRKLEAADCVSSEVHSFSNEEILDKGNGVVLSRFVFSYPCHISNLYSGKSLEAVTDKDGDLSVVRKNHLGTNEDTLFIEHLSSTTLDLVGEQVWRGALFLADYLFHNSELFKDLTILEVAAGVGLTSIAASLFAKKVVITDVNKGNILKLINNNVKRNAKLMKGDAIVKELDFCSNESIENLKDLIEETTVIIAADVVYHNDLTDHFFKSILELLSKPPSKSMYIALEKRYVFTIDDFDTVAPCYDYFLTGLEWLKCQKVNEISWTIEEVENDFPQYFTYERTRHMVLWKINANIK